MNRVLQHLSRLLRRVGVVLLSGRHPAIRYLDHPPVSGFDTILLQLFPNLHGLNFLQVGANDGQRADPLNRYIDDYAWSGLMFEPLPGNFADLQHHRGGCARLKLYQTAIDTTAGTRPIYDLASSPTAGLPNWTRGLASFSRERLADAARELKLPESSITVTEIETITWEQAWAKFGQRRCDLLVIDTEGHDLPLLRAADISRHRPRLIMFEHACSTLPERLEAYRELLSLGYELTTSEGDTIAWLPRSTPGG